MKERIDAAVNVGHFPTAPLDVVMELLPRYAGVRWMNWAQAYQNSSPVLAGRMEPPFFAGGPWKNFAGVPLANLVELAQQTGAPTNYFNLPYALNAASLKEAARLLATLGGKVYATLGVECGFNEAGGYGPAFRYHKRVAGGHGYWDGVRGYAMRIAYAAAHMGRKLTIEAHSVDVEKARRLIEVYGLHSGNVQAIAIAPYFGRPPFVNAWLNTQGRLGLYKPEHLTMDTVVTAYADKYGHGATVQALLDATEADLNEFVMPGVGAHVDLGERNGEIPVVWYEWNHHLKGKHAAIAEAAFSDGVVEMGNELSAFGVAKGTPKSDQFVYRLNHTRSADEHWRMNTIAGHEASATALAGLVA